MRSRRSRKLARIAAAASCGPLTASTAAHCEICDAQESVFVIQRVKTGASVRFAANRALAPVFTRWITNTDSRASQISQWAAVEAVSGPQEAAAAMRASFLERRDLIVGLLNEVPSFACKVPGGAFYAWPNVTEACRMTGCADSEVFRKRLLHDAGVAVLADIHFGRRVPGDGQHIRFSYAAAPDAIREGVRRIDAFVRRNAK